ncbi:D-alanyl-D-alanine carboxypeptidase [Streptomyces collinus]|uniref:D-alanyl-D-alanine carboxypeptidase n=1 Tax=Streptomyces collinus (strain DSM 40733 / Tue 365) TaxID=1214242 RepID=S5ULQ2_STRC3|nr:serine hydrolase [Streptomyces collinus]AGS67848.1 D-alanyl-D-alanine carboxypeptidase [Streptomyces collinus Tu 365]UJA06480.1 D-alanyl-D-alanine carboxypeptidase [Streptomyces collinus]UJA12350.1 D-alanyl-D-alanine carboxypeptidase [Streptomyces collinus]UJA12787.1 D-alanyl-D-alanine carboxypeptidase [Streptomyces collinus]UJA18651.1 D-alanyl-D-alanine carboxypeptidase [Streptomyces collinus]
MITGITRRTAVSACSLCVAGVLALAPAAAATAHRAGDPAPPRPRAAVPRPSLLFHPGPQVRARRGAPEVPEVSALSWVVADAGSGEVLAANNAHRRLPPASTLKTLFALTVLPGLPATRQHTVRYEDLEDVGEGSSLVGVEEGHTYQVADLWRGVFLSSGNDAVHVLASLGGGWQRTAAKMQTKAVALGALDTHVVSPDGYDADGQVSSAYDLAVFGREGLRNPDFARYCSTAHAEFPGDGWPFAIENTNRLLTGEDGVAPYPGLIGIKNGYTSNAGNTLVAAARRDGRTLVVTVMNPQDGGGFEVYEEARQLLDWGFAAAGRVDPVGSLDALRAAPAAPASAAPVAATAGPAPDDDSDWPGTVAVAGLAGLGAFAVTRALRAKNARGADG